MHCINKSHFEVKNLAEKLGNSLDVTAAKIAIWQEDNEEYDRFPTYEELNEEGDLSTMYTDALAQLEKFNGKDAGVFSKDTFNLSELKKEYPLLSINIEKSGNSIKPNATFKKVVDKASVKLKQLEDSKRTREFESLKREDTSEEPLLSVQEYKHTHGSDVFIQQKYFSTGRVQKASAVLEKIVLNSPNFANMAKVLLPIVKRINDVDLILRPNKIIEVSEKFPEASGVFYSASNTIEIAQHAKHRNRLSEPLLIHEILHSISYKALGINNAINKDFKATYDKATSILGTFNPSTKEGLYGTYSIDEFFVGLFTDGQLIKALENIEAVNTPSYKNLFEEIFDIILKILNFKSTDNLYTQAFSIATNIIDVDRIEKEEQEFRMQAELERDAFEADMQVNQNIYNEMLEQQKTLASLPYESKPGVEDLFNSNPELASIGTPQQYSQYLDTIFPDSKVKDIVYHATDKKFDKFKNPEGNSIFFAPTKEEAWTQKGDVLISAILNIKNPKRKLNNKYLENPKDFDGTLDLYTIEYVESLPDEISEIFNEITVFEPEQIHILGNNNDIEGFKEFVNTQEEPKFKTIMQSKFREIDEDVKYKIRPKNTLNNIEREKFKRSVSPGDKTTFKHWNENYSIVEEYVDINIGDVFDEDFEGYYNEDDKQKFKYENVISNERPNKYDIEEQAIFKNKLYVGAGVVFYVDNIKVEGNITEVGSSMFSVAVDDEIKTFEYADIDSENYERNISELVYGVKEVLKKQLKAFSKKVSTEEQVQRLASVEKALFQLENYKGIDDLLGFMNTVQKSIAKSNALLNNLERKDLPVDKKLAMMSYVKDYIKSFDIMKQLASQINKLDGSDKLKAVSNTLLTELTLTEENYYDRVIPELADWLWSVFPENLNKELLMTKQKPWTKERLIQELRSPSGDLDFFNTYLVPTSNSNDVITGLFSKILKRALDAGRYAVYQMEQALKPAFQKVQDRFSDMEEVYKNFYTIKDLKVMENGEEKTKKVRYIIEQYNLQEYYDNIRDFKSQTNDLWKKLKEADTKTEKDSIKREIDKIEAKKLKYQKTYGALVTASKMKIDMEALRDRDSPKFNYDTFGNYLSYFYKITATPSANSLEVIDEETGEVTYYEYKENRWNPDKSKFETDEYKELAKGDEDIFNLYKEYKKIYDDLERMLPESRKMKGLIPCHYEDKAVVNVGKWWKNLTTSTDKQYLSTLGGEVYRQIPIGYSRALDVSESSNDILSSLMKYSLEVHHFKAKNDVLGGVDGLTAVLEKYKPFDATQQSKTKSELNNRRDGIKKFIKQVFYSETRASDAWYDKAIDFFAKGTSVMRMAIKPSNAIANIIMGNYANFSEAYGGRNFTTKDLLKAEKDYFHMIATNPQKLANMLNTLDAVQGRYNLEVGQAFRSTKSKFTIDNIFILQDLGEHQIQGVAMLALLEAKKVPIPEDGNFDLSTLPDNFIDTLHELNKANHGVYNQFDRLYMQDQAIFRLFLQFRKWIVPTFRSRFSGSTEDWRNPQGTNKYRIDIESGTVESGYYGMFFRFIFQYGKDLKRLPNILADAKNLDPIAKEGVKRTLRDGASLLAISALFLPLAGADDDDWVNEEHGDIANWIHWEIIYQLERLRADLSTYVPFLGFKDEMRIVNQPFAAASTAVQMYELFSMMFDIEEREDGTYGWAQYKRDYGRYKKGDLKMWSRASKLNPLDNPLEDLSPEIQYNNFKASSNA
jgi:hypothetical protein